MRRNRGILDFWDRGTLEVGQRQASLSLRSVWFRLCFPCVERQSIAKLATSRRQLTVSQRELATSIFQCIRCINISMASWFDTTEDMMSRFVKFLRVLPHLTDLRIYEVRLNNAVSLSSTFADVYLPTVATLCLPDELYTIFRAFPHVTTLRCAMYNAGTMQASKAYLPLLQRVAGLRMYKREARSIASLAYHLPHLRAISVESPLSEWQFKQSLWRFGAFTYLKELAFYHRDAEGLISLEDLVARTSGVLGASPCRDAKVLKV
ncbi:hypothetical protein B0H13DRAFT_2123893 [Mycena leptocephala]|nr:hypothetical protein B0H13DRAFT_2123893 [Mycena leptocephala]